MRFPLAVTLAVFGLSGCQCTPCTEYYADCIDDISDHECHSEVLYVPGLDLQRIGKPDWCRFGCNSKLCPCLCPHAVYVDAHRNRAKESGQYGTQAILKGPAPAMLPADDMPAVPPAPAYEEPAGGTGYSAEPLLNDLKPTPTPPPPPPPPALKPLPN